MTAQVCFSLSVQEILILIFMNLTDFSNVKELKW